MAKYTYCKICNAFHYDNENCPPVFFIFHEEYMGNESQKIHACGFEEAAEKYAEHYDSQGDYNLANGNEITVTVQDEKGEQRRFKLSAEPTVNYSAEEIESEDN